VGVEYYFKTYENGVIYEQVIFGNNKYGYSNLKGGYNGLWHDQPITNFDYNFTLNKINKSDFDEILKKVFSQKDFLIKPYSEYTQEDYDKRQ
jgi:hypothetical protein